MRPEELAEGESQVDPAASQTEGQGTETETAGTGTEVEAEVTSGTEGTAAKPEAKPEVAVAKPAPAPDWRDKKIAKLTERLRAAQTEQKVEPTAGNQADVDRLVEQRAALLAEQRSFHEECERHRLAGVAAFGQAEFTGALGKIQGILDGRDPADVAKFNDFLVQANETGETAKIIMALSTDLDEADRVFNLSPTKRAMALAKLSMTEVAPVSSAPKPPTVVGSKGASRTEISANDKDRADTLSTEAWMARREAEVKSRREARGR